MNDSTIDRTFKPQSALSAAVDRLSSNTPHWTTERLVDEGLDLIRDYCWASSSALFRSAPNKSAPNSPPPVSPRQSGPFPTGPPTT